MNIKWVVYVLAMAVTALSIIVGLQFQDFHNSRVDARTDSRATWSAVICTIEQSELSNPKTSAAKKAQAVKFWTDILVNRVHTTPCD